MKIVFMGSPEFAVYALQNLHDSQHQILAVVTIPDMHQGRGLKLSSSPVKIKAIELGYKVLQPISLKSLEFYNQIKELSPELIIVVAFKKLTERIFRLPVFGTVNAHASLLPKYRGAAPINAALRMGEKKTGVTTFYINSDIDAGTILLQEECLILEEDNFTSLYNKLAIIAADLLVKTCNELDHNGIAFKYQDSNQASYAPKITSNSCLINWALNGLDILNHIRSLSFEPGAFSYLNGEKFKLLKAHFYPDLYLNAENGEIVLLEKKRFGIKVNDGIIVPEIVHLQGKKQMDSAVFLNGNKLSLKLKLG